MFRLARLPTALTTETKHASEEDALYRDPGSANGSSPAWRKNKKLAPVCSQDLRCIGEETSERYEFIRAALVIDNICKKYACACTEQTAGKPPKAQRRQLWRCCVASWHRANWLTQRRSPGSRTCSCPSASARFSSSNNLQPHGWAAARA
jgi:hypothetical protein